MRRNHVVWMIAFFLLAILSPSANAEPSSNANIGFHWRIPYQAVSNDGNLKAGANGSSLLLTFGLDNTTTIGILSEHISFVDKTAAGAAAPGSYDVSALRITKDASDTFFVGLDLGTATSAATTATLGDVIGGARLLGSRGKINTFFNFEIMYRLLNPTASFVATGTTTNFGGGFVALSAGVTF